MKKRHNCKCDNCCQSVCDTGADTGFPVGGGTNPWGGGRQHTNLPDFPKNCMKLRKFWSPLESATVINVRVKMLGPQGCIQKCTLGAGVSTDPPGRNQLWIVKKSLKQECILLGSYRPP